MPDRPVNPLVQYIRHLAEVQQSNLLSDQELLRRFAADGDQAAFTALVRRHGPMVSRVCWRVLRHGYDTEDAFQATFMVLARQAGSRRWQPSIAKWLYKVAQRVALRTKAAALRRQTRERQTDVHPIVDPTHVTSLQQAEAVLNEELERLPESLRLPLVFCCLENQTHQQVAQQLGCSEKTIVRRISRARELLRSRLESRGVAFSMALLVVGMTSEAMAVEMPALLVGPTVRAAVAFAARQGGLEAGISSQVVTLAEGVLQAMVLTKIKLAALLLAATLVVGTASALICQRLAGTASSKDATADQPAVKKVLTSSSPRQAISADEYGDPLPDGAVGRLGTVRWRHGDFISFLAFPAHGKSVLSASHDQTARWWDLATGQELRKLDMGSACVFALATNGNVFAAGGTCTGIHLYDVMTGKELQPIQGSCTGVAALALSPEGQFLAAVESNGTIRLWEVATGTEPRPFPDQAFHPNVHAVDSSTLAFAADGKTLCWAARLASRGVYNWRRTTVIQVWDTDAGQKLSQVQLSGNYTNTDLIFSNDGQVLAWGAGGNTLCLSQTRTGQEICKLKVDEGLSPTSLAFSPDGRVLAVRDEINQRVELWDTTTGQRRWRIHQKTQRKLFETGRLVQTQKGIFHSVDGKFLAFSADSTMLAVGGESNTVRLLEVATGQEIRAVGGHQAAVSMVCFGPDGKTLLSYGADDTARLWDIRARKEVRQIQGLQETTTAPVLSQDGRIAAALEKGMDAIRIWDTTTGEEIRRIAENRISLFALSPDGRQLAVHTRHLASLAKDDIQCMDEDLLFDVATGNKYPIRRLSTPHGLSPGRRNAQVIRLKKFKNFIFSPDSQILALLFDDVEKPEQLRLWDRSTGSLWRRFEFPAQCLIRTVAFASNGRSLALDLGNGMVSVWETATGRERCFLKKTPPSPTLADISIGLADVFLGMSSYVRPVGSNLAFSPDGKLLVQGHTDGTISVWDVAAGTEIGILRGHQGKVQTVAFAPDGTTLASGSVDTSVLIWDMRPWTQGRPVANKDLTDRDIEAYWADLIDNDAAKAFKAVVVLASAPGKAVSFLQKHLRPAADTDACSRETRKPGQNAVSELSGGNISGEPLRQLRAIEALAWMDTPEARQVLQTLTQELPDAALTRAAQTALQHLGR